jgi:hypothetical protein
MSKVNQITFNLMDKRRWNFKEMRESGDEKPCRKSDDDLPI